MWAAFNEHLTQHIICHVNRTECFFNLLYILLTQ